MYRKQKPIQLTKPSARSQLVSILTSKVFLVILSVYLVLLSELLAMTVYAQSAVRYNPDMPVLYVPQKTKPVTQKQTATSAPTPPSQNAQDTATTYPYRITIPSLGVNAGVLSLGVNQKGEMAVPTTLYQTSWYNRGTKPGQVGSAVIAGHYGAPNQNGIFRNLLGLKNGSVVTVASANGQTYNYQVYKIANISQSNAPLQEIFNKKDGAYLNLITCFGTWNQDTFSYNQRTVVYTKLIK